MTKKILFVEDDADDRELIAYSLQKEHEHIELVFAEDGLQAMDYLTRIRNNDTGKPCLIVLDLNLPIIDGKQLFLKIKDELKLVDIPVLIFTSSLNPNDKEYFHANSTGFITKPNNFNLMSQVANQMLALCYNS